MDYVPLLVTGNLFKCRYFAARYVSLYIIHQLW